MAPPICRRSGPGRQGLLQCGMTALAAVLIAVVVLIHLYIVVLEMVLWDKPFGRKVFGNSQEFATASKVLAANQGLYNGFLAAGLIWGLVHGDAGRGVVVFFLLCVIAAGLFGAATASRKILWAQGLPGMIALGAWLVSA